MVNLSSAPVNTREDSREYVGCRFGGKIQASDGQ